MGGAASAFEGDDVNRKLNSIKALYNGNKETKVILREIEELKSLVKAKRGVHSAFLYYQTAYSSYPPLHEWEKRGISLDVLDDSSLGPVNLLFYVVQHTARFESVNLDMERLKRVKQRAEGKVVIVAMTPGSSDQTPRLKTLSTGDDPICLYFDQHSHLFNDKENEAAYKKLAQLIQDS